MGRIEVAAAGADEWPMACRLALGNAPADTLDTRVARLLELVQTGTYDSAGLLIARRDGAPVGAIAAQNLPGGTGVVLPPYGPDDAIREALVAASTAHFRWGGAEIAHCLLAPEDAPLAVPLLAGGYRVITQIQNMLRHGSILPEFPTEPHPLLNFRPYSEVGEAAFAAILERTYVGTLDLPETTLDRPAVQQLEGYRHGQPTPPHWHSVEGPDFRPVGVVMLTELPLQGVWEIGYLGLVPEARGRGWGKSLLRWAIAEAKRAGIRELGLSVDVRNEPAIRLYRDQFFRIYELQDLYLMRLAGKN